VQLVDQWRAIEETLPVGWEDVRMTLSAEQVAELDRAAQVLGPTGAGRRGESLVLHVRRAGGAQGPEAARRLFGKLDQERIWCTLDVDQVSAGEARPEASPAEGAPAVAREPLAAQWAAQLATLPDDWGSLLCELEVESTALIPRVALLCAPLNPTRVRGRRAFSFRVAKRAGYGASSGMTARCLARCDEEGLAGRVSTAGLFPETDNVATQGPVFTVGGKPL
jgi:hypothetical protein